MGCQIKPLWHHPRTRWNVGTLYAPSSSDYIRHRFREAVINAYNGRCALSGLPEPLLLDAAHIVADTDMRLGQPVVPNGIPLSKIHHAAFDTHLIGIDPDYRLHVSERLLIQTDGPMLESLKRLNGGNHPPPETETRIAPIATGLHCASSDSRRQLELAA